MGSFWSLLKVVIVGGHCYLLLLCIGGGWGWWLLLVVCVDGGGKEKGSHITHHHIGITFELPHEITCKWSHMRIIPKISLVPMELCWTFHRIYEFLTESRGTQYGLTRCNKYSKKPFLLYSIHNLAECQIPGLVMWDSRTQVRFQAEY